MNWKYHILHSWPEPRQYWEDIFLLPDTPAYTDEAIWLTIDALGDVDHPESHNWSEMELDEMLEKLGEEDYWIEGNERQ